MCIKEGHAKRACHPNFIESSRNWRHYLWCMPNKILEGWREKRNWRDNVSRHGVFFRTLSQRKFFRHASCFHLVKKRWRGNLLLSLLVRSLFVVKITPTVPTEQGDHALAQSCTNRKHNRRFPGKVRFQHRKDD